MLADVAMFPIRLQGTCDATLWIKRQEMITILLDDVWSTGLPKPSLDVWDGNPGPCGKGRSSPNSFSSNQTESLTLSLEEIPNRRGDPCSTVDHGKTKLESRYLVELLGEENRCVIDTVYTTSTSNLKQNPRPDGDLHHTENMAWLNNQE